MNSNLSIQQAAQILGVSAKTLRRWETSGVLIPQRTAGGQRRYSLEQIKSFKKPKRKAVQTSPAASPALPLSPISPTFSTPVVSDTKGVEESTNFVNHVLSSPLLPKQKTILAWVLATVFVSGLSVAGLKTLVLSHTFKPRTVAQQLTLPIGTVLAAESVNPQYNLRINIPAIFTKDITAPNVVYGVTAGTGIKIEGTAQNPIISATAATQSAFSKIKINTAEISATGADTLTFAAGNNVSISTDTTTNKITISSTDTQGLTGTIGVANGGTGLTSIAANSLLYASAQDTLAGLPIGTDGQILTVASGVPTWSASSSNCTGACIGGSPTSTQTILPTSSTATGLSIAQASSGSVDIFNVTNSTGSTKYLQVNSSGVVNIANLSPTNVSGFTLTGNVVGSGTPTLSGLGSINGATISGGSLTGGSLSGGTYTSTGLTAPGSYTVTIGSGNSFNVSNGTTNIFSVNDITGSAGISGDFTINKDNPTLIYDASTAGENDFWAGVRNNSNAIADDTYQIGTGTTPGANSKFILSNAGDLTLSGNASASGNLTLTGASRSLQTTSNNSLTIGGSSTGNIFVAPLNGATGSYIAPVTDNQVDLGTAALTFRTVYAQQVIPAGVGTSGYFQRASGILSPTFITDDLAIGGTSTASAKFQVIGTTGHVSIGTIGAPKEALDLNGVLYLEPTASPSATVNRLYNMAGTLTWNGFDVCTTGNACASTGTVGITGSPTAGQVAYFASASNLAGSNQFYFDSVNSLFGIGTSSPQSKLQVDGQVTGKALTIFNQTAGGDQNLIVASQAGVPQFVVNNAGLITTASVNSASIVDGSIANVDLANSTITVNTTAGTGIAIGGSAVALGGTLTVNGIDASTSNKGVAQFNSTNFTASSGLINTIQNIDTTASPAFTGLTLSGLNTAGAVVYTDSNGKLQITAQGSSGQLLKSNGSAAPSWIPAPATPVNYLQLNAGILAPGNDASVTSPFVLGGNTSTVHQFEVNGTVTGKALVSLNDNGSGQNILVASASGTNVFALDRLGNITNSGTINGQTISSAANFTGSLTVANGFTVTAGSVSLPNSVITNSNLVNSAITINSAGILSGGGSVSLGGNITLTATEADTLSSVTGRGASTSTRVSLNGGELNSGAVTGQAFDIINQIATGDQNLFVASQAGVAKFIIGNTGTLTTTLSSGAVYSNAGVLTSEAQLAITRGGTNSSASPAVGQVAYGDGVSYQFTSGGTTGNLLQYNSGGAPTWVNSSTINFWQRAAGVVAPLNITDDLVLGGTATSSALFQVSGTTGLIKTASVNSASIVDGSVTNTDLQNSAITFNTQSSGGATSLGGTLVINGGGINTSAYSAGTITITGTEADTLASVTGRGATTTTLVNLNGGILSSGAITGQALVRINETGDQDLLTASAAGIQKFTVNHNGLISTASVNSTSIVDGSVSNTDLTNSSIALAGQSGGPGTVALGGTLTINGSGIATTAISGSTYTITATEADTLASVTGRGASTSTLVNLNGGQNSSGAVTGQAFSIINQVAAGDQNLFVASQAGVAKFIIGNTGTLTTTLSSGAVYSNAGVLTSEAQLAITRGGTNSTATPSLGQVAYGDGSAYQFTSGGSTGSLLQYNSGGAPTWVSTSSVNFWQRAAGVVAPLNITDDLVLGGTATSSALFQVSGTTGLIKTASVNSASIVDGSVTNTDLQNSSITFNTQSSGGATSLGGTLVINGGGINTSSYSAGTITITGTEADTLASVTGRGASTNTLSNFNGGLTSTGALTGLALVRINETGDQDLLTASAAGVQKFTVNHNGLISTASVNSTSIVDGSVSNTDLTNSAISLASQSGSGSVALGGTLTLNGSGIATTALSGSTYTITATEADTLASVTGRGASTSTLSSFNGGLSNAGAVTGKAFAIFNETGDQNIIAASASGTTIFQLSRTGNLTLASNAGANTDTLIFAPSADNTGSRFSATISTANLTGGNQTFLLPDLGSATSTTICTTSSACASTGSVTDTPAGSNNQIAFFTGADNITGSNNFTFDSTSNLFAISGAPIGKALTILNQTGDQNIFVASSAGVAKFIIGNTGTLTTTLSSGAVYSNAGVLTSEAQLAITRGGTNSTATPTNGQVAYGDGSAYQFTSGGSTGNVLSFNSGSAPTWISTSAINFWQRAAGVVAPLEKTNDLVIGGIATASAKIQLFGVTGGETNTGARTGQALVQLNETGDQDLLTASAGGVQKFTVNRSGFITTPSVNNGSLALTNSAVGGYILSYDSGSNGFTWIANTGGSGASKWQLNSNVLAPLTTTNQVVLGGPTSTNHLLELNGKETGKALAVFNETGDQNIFVASQAGVAKFIIGNTGTLTTTLSSGAVYSNAGVLTSEAQLAITRGGTNSTATPTNGQVAYGDGSAYQFTSGGSTGNILQFNSGSAPTWVSSATINFWQRALGVVAPAEITNDLVIGGTATSSALFQAFGISGGANIKGARTGQALVQLNETGNSDLLTASAAGVQKFTVDHNGLISTASVNSASIVDGSVTNTDLQNSAITFNTQSSGGATSLGGTLVINGGGINTSAYSAGTITITGTEADTLASVTGRGASTSTKVSLNGGELNSGAVTGQAFDIINQVAAGDQNLFVASQAGVAKFIIGNTGTLTTTLNSGAVYSNAGVLTSEAQLAVTRGGTNSTATPSLGQVAYGDGSAYQFTSGGSTGNLLQYNSGSAPTWVSTSVINFWQRAAGVVAPLNITDDLVLGGTATSSALFQVSGTTGLIKTASVNSASIVDGSVTNTDLQNSAITFNTQSSGGATSLGGTLVINGGGINTSAYSAGTITITGTEADTLASVTGRGATTNTLVSLNGGLTSTGAITGLALVRINETGDQALITASASGVQKFTVDHNGLIATASVNSASIVDGSVANTDLQNSSISLASQSGSGSVALGGTLTLNGSGIATTSESGSTYTITATEADTLSSVTGRGANTSTKVSLDGGELSSGAVTGQAFDIINQVAAGDQNLFVASQSGVAKFIIGNTGTLTTTLASGAIYSNAGILTSENQLAITRGGTNSTATPSLGQVAYGDGSAYQFTSGGSTGNVLKFNSGSAPTWVDVNTLVTAATNYWQLNAGMLSPFSLTAGINIGATATSSARLSVSGSATSGLASVIINQPENTDLFTASAAGVQKFTVGNTGLISTASVNSASIVDGSVTNTDLQNSSITFNTQSSGGATSLGGTLVINGGGINTSAYSAGTITITGTEADTLASVTGRGASTSTLVNLNGGQNSSGAVTGQAFDIINQIATGDQNLFVASQAGVAKFIIGNTGTLTTTLSSGAVYSNAGVLTSEAQLATTRGGTNSNTTPALGQVAYGDGAAYQFTSGGTTGNVLQYNSGSAPTWVNTSTFNFWQRALGVVAPLNITDDLVLGGTATSSALFQVSGTTGLITTASVNSASIVNGSVTNTDLQNSAITFNTQSSGGATSLGGTLVINGGGINTSAYSAGTITITGTEADTLLSVTGRGASTTNTVALNGGLTSTGALTGLALVRINETGDQDLLTASAAGVQKFTVNHNGLISTASVNSTSIVDGSVANADLTNSSITLNASTGGPGSVALGGTLTLNGTGSTTVSLTGSTYTIDSTGGGSNFWQLGTGTLAPGNLTLDTTFADTATASAKVVIGGSLTRGKSALIVNQTEATDIFAASASGVAKFRIDNSGNVYMPTGTGIDTIGAGGTLSFGNSTSAHTINIGNGGTSAQTLNIGSTSSTSSIAINSGTSAQTFTSLATSNNPFAFVANSLTSGNELNVSSTSNAITSGRLGYFNWEPTTPATASGDLLGINIGNGGFTTGNLFNITSAGSSLFSVSQSQVTANLPTNFTGSGDVTIANDLNFTNPTAAYINFTGGPGYIRTYNPSGNNDLTLSAANQGDVIIADSLQNVGAQTGRAMAIFNETGDQAILSASASGVQVFTLGRTGILTLNQNSQINTTGTMLIDSSGTLSINTTNNQAITTGTGTTTIAGDLNANGTNITLGNAITDNITFTGRVAQDADLIPITATGTNDLGTALLPWDNLYVSTIPGFTLSGAIVGSGTPTLSGLGTINTATISGGSLTGGSLSGGTYSNTGLTATGNYQIQIGNTGNLTLYDGTNTLLTIADAGTAADISGVNSLVISGSRSGNALAILNETGTDQNLFTASAAGATKFNITRTGNLVFEGATTDGITTTLAITDPTSSSKTITLPNLTGTVCLDTNNCVGSTNFWQQNSGMLSPYSLTSGLAIGDTATAGAGLRVRIGGSLTSGLASLIVNQPEATDIFAASASGTNRLRLANNGDLTLTSTETTGNANQFNFNSLSTGNGLFGYSTSTALTTGRLGYFNWEPSAVATASGDLVGINIGNGGFTTGNLFNITNAGSSLFSVSQNAVTSNLPTSFTAAGDVSIAYDLQFTNPTASYIKSKAPLYIQAGQTYNSDNLTLKVYNSGRILGDATQLGGLSLSSNISAVTPQSLLQVDGASTGQALVVLNETGNQDILTASAGGVNVFKLDRTGAITVTSCTGCGGGLNNWQYSTANGTLAPGNLTVDTLFGATATASARVKIAGSISSGKAALIVNQPSTDATDLFTASAAGVQKFRIDNSGILYLVGNQTTTGDITTIPSAAGTSINIIPSVPTSTGNGVATTIKGSAATTTGNGGAVNLTAGAAAGAAGTGGGINLTSGAGGASGTAPSGAIALLTGNASSGTAGNISLDVGTSTSSNGSILLGTAARNQTITLGNTTNTTAVTINSGTVSGTTTASALALNFNALTSGTGEYIASSTLSTGILFHDYSTSTALTSGKLGYFNWEPSAVATASGDLVGINIGNGGFTTGNLFNITNAGSSLFSVNQNQITASIPQAFNAAGDVSMAYDLNFTNPTASYIKSQAPLYLQTGPSYSSNNLTMTTYNSGRILGDMTTLGGMTLSSNLAAVAPSSLLQVDGTYTGKALAIFNQTTSTQDILDASIAGATAFRLTGSGNAMITGSSKYLNFGGTEGTTGYGFFDNAGVLQFKNSGGGWTNFGAGGGWDVETGYMSPGNLTLATIWGSDGASATASATFRGRFAGSNTTGQASLIVNQFESNNDIFAASASGTNKFRIDTAGVLYAPNYNTSKALLYTTGTAGQIAALAANGGATQCLVQTSGGDPTWSACSGTASTSWSNLSNPSADLSLAMGNNHTLFTWSTATGATDMFKLVDTTGNTGTGYLLNVGTVGTSTAKPFTISAQGTTIIDTTATGNISLGGADVAQTIDIGNSSGAMTGTINIGGSTGAQTLNFGGGNTGIKTINIGTGTAANVISIGTGQTAGSIALGSAMTSGTIDIGNSSGAMTGTITIGGSTGAQTLNIGGGDTGIKTVNIAGGSAANVITIANTQTAGSFALGAAMTSGTIDIGNSSGAMTGTINIGGSTGAQTLNFGGGNTGIKTINVGTGTAGNIINIGTGASGTAAIHIGDGSSSTQVFFFPKTAAPASFGTNGMFAIGNISNAAASGRIWIRSGNVNFRYASTSNALDYSEYLQQNDTSEPGDVMVMSDTGRTMVHRSTSAYDTQIMGVVSKYGTGHQPFDCWDEVSCGVGDKPNWANVGMLGQVYTKVSTENGPIKPGDPLTSSHTTGVAMKAVKAGRIVGYALDNYDGSQSGPDVFDNLAYPTHTDTITLNGQTQTVTVGKIMIFLQASSYNPGEPPPDGLDQAIITHSQDGSYGLVDNNGRSWDNLFVAKDAAIANLKVGQLTADRIVANQIEGLNIMIASAAAQLNITPTPVPDQTILTSLRVDHSVEVGVDLHVLGNLALDGTLNVLGASTFAGDVNFAGMPTFNKDTAGFAVIPSGTRKVEVLFDKEYAQTPIVTANAIWDATANQIDTATQLPSSILPKQDYIVAGISTKGFTLLLDQDAVIDLKFSWTAIAVKDAKTISGPTPTPTPSPTPIPSMTPTPTLTPTPTP